MFFLAREGYTICSHSLLLLWGFGPHSKLLLTQAKLKSVGALVRDMEDLEEDSNVPGRSTEDK